MIISPIIPIWLILPIAIGLTVYTIIYTKKAKLIIRLLIIALLFVTNLRFRIPDGEVEVLKSNLDVIFVIDKTISMDALDYEGGTKRLDAVKKDVQYIVDELSGSTYSVIAFDIYSQIKMPLTKDSKTIMASVKSLKTPEQCTAKGSTITMFKEDLKKVLESSRKKEDRQRIVFIITDGENTTDEEVQSLSDLRDYVDNGAVLGYGTEEGGRMKVETYYQSGKYEYLQDKTNYPYTDAISKIDEKNLKQMANDLGIDYIHMDKQSNVKSKLKQILDMRDFNDQDKEQAYKDIYYYFTPLLIALFLVELGIDRRMYQ